MKHRQSSGMKTLRRIVLWAAACSLAAAAQDARLGQLDFPTSGKGEAQAHFLRGAAALHSFWFEEALGEFRLAKQAAPDFLMGYWGEAMAYNHPLWAEQDTDAARAVLAKIKDKSAPTAREQMYLDAVRALYGEGDKLARDIAYSAAMEKIYRAYPDDREAACFYALSLLGTVRPRDKGFRRQMQAAAIALDVFQKNPNHPGAAHYIIHAFDDPEHAILALPAARRYADIAPEAHHARHMPAHIFLQLGMWPESAAANESAWAASTDWVKRKGLGVAEMDLHSLHWLYYTYLQQGRYGKAAETLALRRSLLADSDGGSTAGRGRTTMAGRYSGDMAAEWVVETEQWPKAAELFRHADAAAAAPRVSSDGGAAHAAHAASGEQLLALFIRGLAAARAETPDVGQLLTALRAQREDIAAGDAYRAKFAEIMELEVTGLAAAARGDFDAAVEAMKRATALEESLAPPSGPPGLIKPSHELFGEILLKAGRPQEAAQQFAIDLQRQPNRARGLLGAARAAERSGDTPGAIANYSKLLEIWRQADAQLAELREAQNFLKQSAARAAAQAGH